VYFNTSFVGLGPCSVHDLRLGATRKVSGDVSPLLANLLSQLMQFEILSDCPWPPVDVWREMIIPAVAALLLVAITKMVSNELEIVRSEHVDKFCQAPVFNFSPSAMVGWRHIRCQVEPRLVRDGKSLSFKGVCSLLPVFAMLRNMSF